MRGQLVQFNDYTIVLHHDARSGFTILFKRRLHHITKAQLAIKSFGNINIRYRNTNVLNMVYQTGNLIFHFLRLLFLE
jgi:hypothetical protein